MHNGPHSGLKDHIEMTGGCWQLFVLGMLDMPGQGDDRLSRPSETIMNKGCSMCMSTATTKRIVVYLGQGGSTMDCFLVVRFFPKLNDKLVSRWSF